MNETKKSLSLISVNNSKEVSHRDVAVSTDSGFRLNDGPLSPRSTTDEHSKKPSFRSRIANGYLQKVQSDQAQMQCVLPRTLQSNCFGFNRKRTTDQSNLRSTVKKLFNAFKWFNLSSENYLGTLSASDDTFELKDREPVFVLVDSSCLSSPSSKELLIDEINIREPIQRKHYNKNVQPIDMPSTSRDFRENIALSFKRSNSSDEMQVIDINLQSENEIPVDERELEDNSIVVSYLRNRDAQIDIEEISEESLDVYIPSYPGSPRSVNLSARSDNYDEDKNDQLREAIDYLHADIALLEAAELGDNDRLAMLLKLKETNIHQMNHFGRNALHLAVCYGNESSIKLLLEAGLCPDVKDNVGMTALSLCLMRNPTRAVANLLFDHGATILPRVDPMDTGLFIQFVSMCAPSYEDEKLLDLLVSKGALVNDSNAPGGRQALHIAAMGNNCRLITKLIQLGAKTNARNVRGETPKDFALLFKCKEAYELLSEYDDEKSSLLISNSNDTSENLDSKEQSNCTGVRFPSVK